MNDLGTASIGSSKCQSLLGYSCMARWKCWPRVWQSFMWLTVMLPTCLCATESCKHQSRENWDWCAPSTTANMWSRVSTEAITPIKASQYLHQRDRTLCHPLDSLEMPLHVSSMLWPIDWMVCGRSQEVSLLAQFIRSDFGSCLFSPFGCWQLFVLCNKQTRFPQYQTQASNPSQSFQVPPLQSLLSHDLGPHRATQAL